jgi:hypothetical protein
VKYPLLVAVERDRLAPGLQTGAGGVEIGEGRLALDKLQMPIIRLVGAILLEQNDEWAVQRARYMTLETMARFERRSLRQVARRGRLT